MRDWNLGLDDPLNLTLATDLRLGEPDYLNDQIWGLELGGGDPPAISLCTTYGLRARSMRIFPRFTANGATVTAPVSFAVLPRLRHFYPNFLELSLFPFTGIEVLTEFWVPCSQAIAGRLTLTNHTPQPVDLGLQLCALLVPIEGNTLMLAQIQSVDVLVGRTSNLVPVLFMTGSPMHGLGPYPSLSIDIHLDATVSRQLTWVQAALGDPAASFGLARSTAARAWDAERARIELVNAAQSVEVETSNPDWDAAFALSQKTAFSLFFPGNEHLPQPSFVLARQPDQGCSLRDDGSDYSHLWSGQSPFDACYLSSLLPGAPEMAAGLLRNFLSTQAEDGFVDCRPGLGGQRGRWLAPPLLAGLTWKTYQATGNDAFLAEVFPHLLAFFQVWFDASHDRDRDGFPEWDHPMQTGFEDNPAFTAWYDWAHGVDISTVESPALTACLFREALCLIQMAEKLDRFETLQALHMQASALRTVTEECWHSASAFYRVRDRDTHLSPTGRLLRKRHGAGRINIKKAFAEPVRLSIHVNRKGQVFHHLSATITGRTVDSLGGEQIEQTENQWCVYAAAITSRHVYTRVDEVEVYGPKPGDEVTVSTVDCTSEDQTLCLPLWAGIPGASRAAMLIKRSMLDTARFTHPFGISACAALPCQEAETTCLAVTMPWQQMLGEGMLEYGYREEVAQLVTRLMNAVILNLKQHHAFFLDYHAVRGAGIGERNALGGLAPTGLFLQTLGVQFLSGGRVRLSGNNPFPWPVTVKYRGLTVTRRAGESEVKFPDGRTIALNDPSEVLVCPD